MPENPEVEKEIFNQWQISQDEKSLVSSEEFTSETALIKKSMDGFFNMDIKDEWKENEHDRDENGRFKGNGSSSKSNNDIQAKIDILKSIDFSKDNTLPNLNKDTLEQYGFEDKPVLLKKNIVEKNKANHPDITDDMAREIIGNSLYKHEAVLKANKDKPAYHNFITRLKDDKNSIVLLELSDEKENYEIVNYHYLDDYGVRKKEKIDKNIKK